MHWRLFGSFFANWIWMNFLRQSILFVWAQPFSMGNIFEDWDFWWQISSYNLRKLKWTSWIIDCKHGLSEYSHLFSMILNLFWKVCWLIWFPRHCTKFFRKSFSSVMTKSAKSPETTIPFSIWQGSQKNFQRSNKYMYRVLCKIKDPLDMANCNLNYMYVEAFLFQIMKCMFTLQVTRQLWNKI